MIKALTGWTILEYDKESDTKQTKGGILLLTARAQRKAVKGKTHTLDLDPDANIPDVVRMGKVVSGELSKGTYVLFNRHDAFGFDLNERFYYAIKNDYLMAVVDNEK